MSDCSIIFSPLKTFIALSIIFEKRVKPTTSIAPLCFSPSNSPAPLISKSLIAKLKPDKSDSFSCNASILSNALFFSFLVSFNRKYANASLLDLPTLPRI